MGRQPGGRIATVLHEAAHDEAIVVVERVGWAVCVHLLLIVAPAMVAYLMAKVVVYGGVDVERGLPVHLLALWE